jgi:hypothetical protein
MNRRLCRPWAFVCASIAALVYAVPACSGSSDALLPGDGWKTEGNEGGPCRTTGTGCNAGLVCVSEVCVQADSGAAGTGNNADGSATGVDSGDAGVSRDGAQNDADNRDGSQCVFKHPLVDGGARFCGAGDCYCDTKDSCYATAIATSCCGGGTLTCK